MPLKPNEKLKWGHTNQLTLIDISFSVNAYTHTCTISLLLFILLYFIMDNLYSK